MVVRVWTDLDENGGLKEELIDLDKLKLFGEFRECDEETARKKWGEHEHESNGVNE